MTEQVVWHERGSGKEALNCTNFIFDTCGEGILELPDHELIMS
jgi:hypothetical protein